jgi:hypothetical protein
MENNKTEKMNPTRQLVYARSWAPSPSIRCRRFISVLVLGAPWGFAIVLKWLRSYFNIFIYRKEIV